MPLQFNVAKFIMATEASKSFVGIFVTKRFKLIMFEEFSLEKK